MAIYKNLALAALIFLSHTSAFACKYVSAVDIFYEKKTLYPKLKTRSCKTGFSPH